MWAKAIFELFDIRNWKQSVEVMKQAAHGKLTKEEFVRQITELEYKAVTETALFYIKVWKPECDKKAIITHDRYWEAPAPDSYAKWMSQFTDHFSYPWNVYDRLFDRIRIRGMTGDHIN